MHDLVRPVRDLLVTLPDRHQGLCGIDFEPGSIGYLRCASSTATWRAATKNAAPTLLDFDELPVLFDFCRLYRRSWRF